MDPETDSTWRDYQATLESFRYLSEVRFKLLALLPAVSGAAVGLITVDLEAFKASPLPRLLVGLLGLIVTLGIAFYDQRNSQLYNALYFHARDLEKELWKEKGGQLAARPGRELRFLGVFEIWHDRGLALIYGGVLGAWVFPVACGLMWAFDVSAGAWSVPAIAAVFSVLYGAAMVLEFHRLDAVASGRPWPSWSTSRQEAHPVDVGASAPP